MTGEWTPERIAAARAIYDRCKLWPELSDDGKNALLEMRNVGIEAISDIERLQAWHRRSLETFRAIGVALGLPDPLDPNITDAEGLAAWSGPLSEIERLQALVAEMDAELASWQRQVGDFHKCHQRREQLLRDAGPLLEADVHGFPANKEAMDHAARIRAELGGKQ